MTDKICNINVKEVVITYLSKMEAAGIVLGASVPIILTSRGSDELSRKTSSAITLIYARNIDKCLSVKS